MHVKVPAARNDRARYASIHHTGKRFMLLSPLFAARLPSGVDRLPSVKGLQLLPNASRLDALLARTTWCALRKFDLGRLAAL
jgi:hypothetical protein